MNKLVYSHYIIYDDLNAYYIANKKKFATYPKIIAFFEDIEKKRKQLTELGVVKGSTENKVVSKKKDLRVDLGMDMYDLTHTASMYFFEKGNMEMYKKLKYNKSLLIRFSYENSVKTADIIVKDCTPVLAELKNVNITAASLKKITSGKEEYIAFMKDPEADNKTKARITKAIHGTDKETFRIIKDKLNDAMVVFDSKDKSLFQEYVRIISQK